jgi:hypothetical protein
MRRGRITDRIHIDFRMLEISLLTIFGWFFETLYECRACPSLITKSIVALHRLALAHDFCYPGAMPVASPKLLPSISEAERGWWRRW